MNGIFTYIYHKKLEQMVGKYTSPIEWTWDMWILKWPSPKIPKSVSWKMNHMRGPRADRYKWSYGAPINSRK